MAIRSAMAVLTLLWVVLVACGTVTVRGQVQRPVSDDCEMAVRVACDYGSFEEVLSDLNAYGEGQTSEYTCEAVSGWLEHLSKLQCVFRHEACADVLAEINEENDGATERASCPLLCQDDCARFKREFERLRSGQVPRPRGQCDSDMFTKCRLGSFDDFEESAQSQANQIITDGLSCEPVDRLVEGAPALACVLTVPDCEESASVLRERVSQALVRVRRDGVEDPCSESNMKPCMANCRFALPFMESVGEGGNGDPSMSTCDRGRAAAVVLGTMFFLTAVFSIALLVKYTTFCGCGGGDVDHEVSGGGRNKPNAKTDAPGRRHSSNNSFRTARLNGSGGHGYAGSGGGSVHTSVNSTEGDFDSASVGDASSSAPRESASRRSSALLDESAATLAQFHTLAHQYQGHTQPQQQQHKQPKQQRSASLRPAPIHVSDSLSPMSKGSPSSRSSRSCVTVPAESIHAMTPIAGVVAESSRSPHANKTGVVYSVPQDQIELLNVT